MGFQETFRALGDPTRRAVLALLRTGPMTAGEIGSHFSLTGASMSHHLSVLRQAGLIDDEKSGKHIYYSLNTSVIDDMIAWATGLKGGQSDEA